MYFEGEQAKFKTAKGNTCFEALQSFAELHLDQVRRLSVPRFFLWYDRTYAKTGLGDCTTRKAWTCCVTKIYF